MKFETLAVHAGRRPEAATGAVAPPLYLSTTFERDADLTPLGAHTYIRESNPMQTLLEDALFPLEGGAAALAFASGMAAGVSLLQTLPAGAHVLMPDDAYYGWRVVAQEFLPHWGVAASFCAMDDLDAVRRALTPRPRGSSSWSRLRIRSSGSRTSRRSRRLRGLSARARSWTTRSRRPPFSGRSTWERTWPSIP